MLKEDKTPLYIREIPATLKEDFKILCFASNTSMQDKTIDLITWFVHKNQEKLDRLKKDMK